MQNASIIARELKPDSTKTINYRFTKLLKSQVKQVMNNIEGKIEMCCCKTTKNKAEISSFNAIVKNKCDIIDNKSN